MINNINVDIKPPAMIASVPKKIGVDEMIQEGCKDTYVFIAPETI